MSSAIATFRCGTKRMTGLRPPAPSGQIVPTPRPTVFGSSGQHHMEGRSHGAIIGEQPAFMAMGPVGPLDFGDVNTNRMFAIRAPVCELPGRWTLTACLDRTSSRWTMRRATQPSTQAKYRLIPPAGHKLMCTRSIRSHEQNWVHSFAR